MIKNTMIHQLTKSNMIIKQWLVQSIIYFMLSKKDKQQNLLNFNIIIKFFSRQYLEIVKFG